MFPAIFARKSVYNYSIIRTFKMHYQVCPRNETRFIYVVFENLHFTSFIQYIVFHRSQSRDKSAYFFVYFFTFKSDTGGRIFNAIKHCYYSPFIPHFSASVPLRFTRFFCRLNSLLHKKSK